MEVTEIMFELSHPERMNILHLLKSQNLRMSDIAKQLSITTAETSRHLDRLGNAELIKKNSNNFYYLSSFANVIMRSIAIINFLTDNYEYFLHHDIGVMPDTLLCLEAIRTSEVKHGTLENVSLISDLTKNAKDCICLISDTPMRSLVEANVKKAEEGVKFRIVYPEDVEVPEAYLQASNMEVRKIKNLDVALKYNESMGGLALPNLEGKIDFGAVFFGTDGNFMDWLKKIFEYYWNTG
jgi:predicted transcriptional regulator